MHRKTNNVSVLIRVRSCIYFEAILLFDTKEGQKYQDHSATFAAQRFAWDVAKQGTQHIGF